MLVFTDAMIYGVLPVIDSCKSLIIDFVVPVLVFIS